MFFPNALFLWLTIMFMISIYKKWACRHQRYKQSFQSRLSDSLQFYQGSRYIELETVNRSKEVWSSSIDRDLGIAQFPMTSQNLWSFFLTSILRLRCGAQVHSGYMWSDMWSIRHRKMKFVWGDNKFSKIKSTSPSEIQHVLHIKNLCIVVCLYKIQHISHITDLNFVWASEISHISHITNPNFDCPLKYHISPISSILTLTVPLKSHISLISLTQILI